MGVGRESRLLQTAPTLLQELIADLATSGLARSCSEGVNLHRVDTRMLSTSTRLRYLVVRMGGDKRHLKRNRSDRAYGMEHLTTHATRGKSSHDCVCMCSTDVHVRSTNSTVQVQYISIPIEQCCNGLDLLSLR